MHRTPMQLTGEADLLERPSRPDPVPAEPVRLPPPPQAEMQSVRLSRRAGVAFVLGASLLGWAGIWWLATTILG